jgi:hypothetical protein
MPLDPTIDPRDDPEIQEALSIKYGNGTLLVVPLSSGSLAVFDRSYSLQEIIPDPSDGQFARFSFAFKNALMSKSAEAHYYGEPDDKTWKRDQREAHKLATRPDKSTLDTSDFEF